MLLCPSSCYHSFSLWFRHLFHLLLRLSIPLLSSYATLQVPQKTYLYLPQSGFRCLQRLLVEGRRTEVGSI
jgi:hypothetical protein